MKAGEIVLGYPDETGDLAPMPTPDVLGRNGTYVVLCNLHAKVASYRQYLREPSVDRSAVTPAVISSLGARARRPGVARDRAEPG